MKNTSRNKNFGIILSLMVLVLLLLLVSGCGKQTVNATPKSEAQAPQAAAPAESEQVSQPQASEGETEFSSAEECESAGFECVQELKRGKLANNFIRIGYAKEGDAFELGFEKYDRIEEVCREGLTAVAYAEAEGDECAYTQCPCYVCVACPDGICGKGESKCNCPQDCK